MSDTFDNVGLYASLHERESMWLVVTLSPSPWPEDERPEIVFWNDAKRPDVAHRLRGGGQGYWCYERISGVVYTHREAVRVAESLGTIPWSNGPCLAACAADMDRAEDAYLASLFRDYRRLTGDPRHATCQRTLAALLARGLHKEKLT